ncbi:eukaryotic aspartyl protease family protein [Striga asiatica]|uniref:Eukaryotic aspartyl protease family protein n=1 Tax=Striga asiatica TaxID=4170 RepID=A0A5A7P730_STRAF|nr:eukaryotic aspartyl protease family protein [Striga asiatica]
MTNMIHTLLLSLSTTFFVLETQPVFSSTEPFFVPKSTHLRPLSKTLALPLKTREIPNKLQFTHNVTLTVSLSVGTPPQNVTMVLDTGSELSWLQCNTTCANRPAFDPTRSSTYSPVSCSSATCTDRTQDFSIPASCDSRNLCHAILSYADMSSSEGNLASESFSVGGLGFPGTVFGCMDSGYSSNSEEDGKTTGLMGMNRGSLSFVSQMGFGKFSYCISGSDFSGVLLFGDSNFTAGLILPLNYTPMIQIQTRLPYFNRAAYTVQLEGIRVSEKLLPLPKSVFEPDHTGAGQTMVDSGTQFTFLLGPAYAALRSEFVNRTAGLLRVAGGQLLYRVPGEVRGADSIQCFTFGNSDLVGMEAYVIGHHHQQNVWMEFDLQRERIGVAPVRCDQARRRLGVRP